MAATYTYEPAEIRQRGVSQARFELGDIPLEGATPMLSDEEILAVIEEDPKRRWKRVLFILADAVCMRLSYETDWKDDGTQIWLNQRATRWQTLRDKLKKEADQEATVPSSSAVDDSLRNQTDGGHYFYAGMMVSPYVQPPNPDDAGRR